MALAGVLEQRAFAPSPVRSRNLSATRASGKSGTARGLRSKVLTISAPVIGRLASSVKSPSSTAESSVFDAKKPMPTCMIGEGSSSDIDASLSTDCALRGQTEENGSSRLFGGEPPQYRSKRGEQDDRHPNKPGRATIFAAYDAIEERKPGPSEGRCETCYERLLLLDPSPPMRAMDAAKEADHL